MAPLALLLLLFAFCGLTFLVTEAAACTVKAIARRWREAHTVRGIARRWRERRRAA